MEATAIVDSSVATIETNHTFTITFSDEVTANEDFIKSITLMLNDNIIPVTKATISNQMKLDPVTDLKPNEMYDVAVTMKNGDVYKRSFKTVNSLNTSTPEAAIASFKEKYPQYEYAAILVAMEDNVTALEQAASPNATVEAAVAAIPQLLKTVESLIEKGASLQQQAANISANAIVHDGDIAMQQEMLQTIIDTHITNAPSVEALNALTTTWQNVIALMQATEKANDAGLELVLTLEETNEAIAQFMLYTPFSAQAINAKLVEDLQSKFNTGLTNVAASTSKINSQISSLTTALDNAFDYTLVVEDAASVIATIEEYKLQFSPWQYASAVSGATSTYKKFQSAIDKIATSLTTSSSATTFETVVQHAIDSADAATDELINYVDLYLEKEITARVAQLEKLETAADVKELDYITFDSYQHANDLLLTLQAQYNYYDEFMTFDEVSKLLKETTDALNALENEIKVS